MDNLNSFLTNLVTAAEQQRAVAEKPVMDGANKTRAGSGNVGSSCDIPLAGKTKEELAAAIPSLLTRAKLSTETRLLEERRLASVEYKKKVLEKRARQQATQKRSRGRNHYKRKEATKKKERRKRYERTAGFNAILQVRGAKRLDPVLWDRYIGECFREYTPKYLTVKLRKRPPGFGQNAYYGSKKYPMTVYSFRVIHEKLGVVWDGEHQRQQDGVPVLVVEIEKASL